MKNHKIIPILIVAAFIIGLTGCSKYEDGPAISFRSKKERVANTWQAEKVMRDGNDVTSSYDQYELQMLNDGFAKLVAIYTWNDLSFEYESEGTWNFSDQKEELKLDLEDDAADNTFQILRLTEDELWLREKGNDTEFHLKSR